ncbi:phospholipase DDHD2-like isoform X2 [Macrobrachium nipponense]|uniref:phospholipase DDHD2-like isoform X2 n=1 Tax=Macrobrachium nipponense TaxID=159736 RepID=UPI0030C7FCC6
MSNRTNTNPLLFPASTNSPFEEIQGSAVLIPPSLNALQSHDTASQHQMPEIDLNDSFGISNQTAICGRPATATTPIFSSVVTESDLASRSPLLPQPPTFVPAVNTPFSSPLVPSPTAIPSFSASPTPSPTSVPSFQRPAPISSVIPPFSQTSAPISSVIPPFSRPSVPLPSAPPLTRLSAPVSPVIPSLPKSSVALVSPSVTPPYPKNLSPSGTPLPSNYPLSSEGISGYPPPDRSFVSGSISHVINPSSSPPPVDIKGSTPSPSPSLNMGSMHSRIGTPAGSFSIGSAQGSNSLAVKAPEIPVETSVTKVGFPSPTSSVGGESFYTPSRENVIPLSFENMAASPALQDGIYHPVMHHWFYSVGQPQVWKPFTFKDSLNLEEAFRQGDQEMIPTDGGRYDVSITERLRKPVYWDSEEPSYVRRCSWFKKSPLETQPVPYEEEIAERLEAEYRDAMMTGKWHRQVDVNGGDRIMIHSTRTMIHYVGLDGDFASVNGSHSPLSVKRGTEDFEIMDGEADEVDHILFLVHGIGSVCDLRFRAVEECVDDFRKLGHQLLSSHFKQSVDMGMVGRVEILPVSWHKALHGDATGIDRKLKPITLRSIPKLREFTNDTILDVLLFTSPIYCQHIMDTVASELNRLFNLFCERNPSFKGLVSLGGHSLGSVILFDLLMHQSHEEKEQKEGEESPISKEEFSPHERHSNESISSSINYVMGGQGTGQPSLIYPKLIFKPEAFFLMGSPYAMFVTVRGIDTIGVDYELPTCKRVFNIFHPFDPVAYRLETLIDSTLTNLRPVLIPHHKGRKRMHLELKETIERVGTEFKQKIVDSIQGTWNRLYELYSGASTKSIEHEVDEALASQLYLDEDENQNSSNGDQGTPIGRLNGGRRIDYVLQEKPYESFNEYIFALQAHVTYWESEDTMLLILKELYGPQGISCDAEHTSQPTSASGHHAYEGDSALGSAAVTPTSPPMFDIGSNVSQSVVDSSGSIPQPSAPVPLFTVGPANPPTVTNYTPTFNFPSGGDTPSVIGGRPVIDINSQPKGMDPTAIPRDNKLVGPPPKIPTGTFTRTTPFRR